MPFFGNDKNKSTSLRIGNIPPLIYPQRRVSLFRGSITVETALVLPIFLFAMLSVLMFIEAIRFSDNVSVLLHQNAKELAMYGYASKYANGMTVGKLGDIAFSSTYVRNKVEKGLKEKKQQPDVVWKGNKGIHYLRSEILEDERIDLIASYEILLPYSFLGSGKFRVVDRARVRAWTGYDNTQSEHLHAEEEIVYITSEGEVYHRDRSCKHLNIKVLTAYRDKISEIRNKDGGKYYACEFCDSRQGAVVYVTEYGDRYHGNIGCSRLKRDVYPVPLSEVGGRRLCATCGGKDR